MWEYSVWLPGRPFSLSHTLLQQTVYTLDSAECFLFPLASTGLHALLGGLTLPVIRAWSHHFTSDRFSVYMFLHVALVWKWSECPSDFC